MNKSFIFILVLVAGLVGFFIYNNSRPGEGDVVSKQGLHWHPELSIEIKGQKQEIPANIGIGLVHNPIHTHDNSGTIHLELDGLVKKDNIRLNQFFKIWGKQFNSNCIFEFCNGSDGAVKMFVNGQENAEFENYQMKDKDRIEIKYQ